jgi:hypothetical protein
MGFTLKEEDMKKVLNDAALKRSAGELKNFCYAIHSPHILVTILFSGGLLQMLFMKYFYLGTTDTHLILQRVSAFLNPKDEPIVIPWERLKVLKVKKIFLGMSAVIETGEKKYRLRINRKILGFKKSTEHFDSIMELLSSKVIS